MAKVLMSCVLALTVGGGESVQECPVWQEFVRFNEIKLKKEK